MSLTATQRQILDEILSQQEGLTPDIKINAFRVKHEAHRKQIDELFEKLLIKDGQGVYRVTLKGVLTNKSSLSIEVVKSLNSIIQVLQSHYRGSLDKETSLNELANKYQGLSFKRYDINLLSDLPIFSQCALLENENTTFVTFKLNESILDQPDLAFVLPSSSSSEAKKVLAQTVLNAKTIPNQEKWKLGDGIGGGGQGDVYLATNIQDKQSPKYAYKKLKNKKRINRFKAEAQAISTLSHKNIINIVDQNVDEASDSNFIVYEYCEGGNLEKSLPYTLDEAFQIFFEVTKGLVEAHNKSIYHRDIKPANILLRGFRQEAVIADFGLCYIENEERHTEHHEAVGPRNFMAPELEDGKLDDVTAACDVYSLGKVLYWLLSGGKIFSREKHRDEKYDLVRLHQDPRYEHFNRLLDWMLKPNPEDRWNHAGLVLEPAQQALKLFRGAYHANSPDSGGEICDYCGLGIYEIKADQWTNSSAVHNFGIGNVGGNRTVICICTTCGHMRIFRPDLATKSSMWKNLKSQR